MKLAQYVLGLNVRIPLF